MDHQNGLSVRALSARTGFIYPQRLTAVRRRNGAKAAVPAGYFFQKRVLNMLEKFLDRIEFDSYEDLKANYSVHVPDGFNFAYDVVDDWARIDPGKKALLWCDDNGGRKT